MSERKSLGKKLRFEVFKRDKFQCQYCGQKAPDVVLECDHIHPVAKGGDDDITNLVTACKSCNSGKSDRELSDNALVEKQRAQLAELEERRQQLEWMLQWREELAGFDETVVAKIAEYWATKAAPFSLTDKGLRTVRDWVGKFDASQILEGIDGSCGSYLRRDEEGNLITESVEKAFSMVPRVINNKKRFDREPWLKDLYYCRGILRNRVSYCNDHVAIQCMKEAFEAGAEIEEIRDVCLTVRSWSQFRRAMYEMIDRGHDGED